MTEKLHSLHLRVMGSIALLVALGACGDDGDNGGAPPPGKPQAANPVPSGLIGGDLLGELSATVLHLHAHTKGLDEMIDDLPSE